MVTRWDIVQTWSQDNGSGQSQASGSSDAPNKKRFYALRYRGDNETSPDMVIGMLKVFSIDVYFLLDPDVTLSFFTPLVAKKFDIFAWTFYSVYSNGCVGYCKKGV